MEAVIILPFLRNKLDINTSAAPVLYIFSDFLYLLLYYFPSYRRKVVAENLKNSFPEKSEKELKCIEKKFYRHLADLFIETLSLFICQNPTGKTMCIYKSRNNRKAF